MKLFAKTDTTACRSKLQSFATNSVSKINDGWVKAGDAGNSFLQSVIDAGTSNTPQIERSAQ